MSVHAKNVYFYLWLLKILCPENTSSHISRHLEFIIEQGHRVNWVSGSLDSRVTGSQNVTQFHLCRKYIVVKRGPTHGHRPHAQVGQRGFWDIRKRTDRHTVYRHADHNTSHPIAPNSNSRPNFRMHCPIKFKPGCARRLCHWSLRYTGLTRPCNVLRHVTARYKLSFFYYIDLCYAGQSDLWSYLLTNLEPLTAGKVRL